MNSENEAGRDGPVPHAAAGLEFSTGEGREHWWALLSEPVKQRLLEFAGPVLEWWAFTYSDSQGRPYAVVFGERGLIVTMPTTKESGDPSDRLDVWTFVPSSVRAVVITDQPSDAVSGPRRGGTPAPLQNELNSGMRGFLGNLPAAAQYRLQQPFLARDSIMSSGFHYYGSDAELDAWCFLAGRNSVTFAFGHRTLDQFGIRLPAWQLTCWQAQVVRD